MTLTAERLAQLGSALETLADDDIRLLAAASGLTDSVFRISLIRSVAGWRRDPAALPPVSVGARPRAPILAITPADTPAPLMNITAAAVVLDRPLRLRPSSRQRLFAEAWVRLLRGVFPAASLSVVGAGAEAASEDAIAAVIAYGSDETMLTLSERYGATPVHAHGDRFSVALVEDEGPEGLDPVVDRLIRDILPWDGRGCLAPVLVAVCASFLETTAKAIADRLADAEVRCPRALPPQEISASVHEARAACRARGGRVHAPDRGTSWTVLEEPEFRLETTPGWRTIRIVPVQDRRDLRERLDPGWNRVEAVGLATDIDAPGAVDEVLEGRAESIGWLQSPSWARRQSGNPSLIELLSR